MAATMKFLLFCVVFATASLFSVEGAKPCKVPSRFWCNSVEVATRCGVLEQCRQNEWTRNAQKVDLVVYYETHCPDCVRIVRDQIAPNYNNLSSIMNLTLIPYGKASEEKVGDQWVFKCQHGEIECTGNIIQTCAINLVKEIKTYLPWINCMEQKRVPPEDAAKECSVDFPVPINEILECSTSKAGNEMQHQMALKTAALDPPMRFVPHCTVNGEHTREIEEEAENNLVKLICDTYKGEKPPVCFESK